MIYISKLKFLVFNWKIMGVVKYPFLMCLNFYLFWIPFSIFFQLILYYWTFFFWFHFVYFVVVVFLALFIELGFLVAALCGLYWLREDWHCRLLFITVNFQIISCAFTFETHRIFDTFLLYSRMLNVLYDAISARKSLPGSPPSVEPKCIDIFRKHRL